MFPFVRCATCNNSLGEYFDLYELLKNNIYEEELKKFIKIIIIQIKLRLIALLM